MVIYYGFGVMSGCTGYVEEGRAKWVAPLEWYGHRGTVVDGRIYYSGMGKGNFSVVRYFDIGNFVVGFFDCR